MTILSYAQNFEDVMLWRALKNITKGYYIDIGAHDPFIDSVSQLFYEQGWRGFHVEPLSEYCDALRSNRRDETVLQATVAEKAGVHPFYEISGTGISTGDIQIAEAHRQRGFAINEIVVPSVTLKQVFEQAKAETVHWLKIDVEGMEEQVLQGWGDAVVRPWVVIIESTLPLTQQESHEKWEHHLTSRGYEFTYFDGLNRFYLAQGQQNLRAIFHVGPNVFDDFALVGSASASFCSYLNENHQKEKKNFEEQLKIANHLQEATTQKLVDANNKHIKHMQDNANEKERVRVETEQYKLTVQQQNNESRRQALQLSETRQLALNQQANEALQIASLEGKQHLEALLQSEHTFSIRFEELQSTMMLNQLEAEKLNQAAIKRAEEDLQTSRHEASSNLQKLKNYEYEFHEKIFQVQLLASNKAEESSLFFAERVETFRQELQLCRLQALRVERETKQREQAYLFSWNEREIQYNTVSTMKQKKGAYDLSMLKINFDAVVSLEQKKLAELKKMLTITNKQLELIHNSLIWRIARRLRIFNILNFKSANTPELIQPPHYPN